MAMGAPCWPLSTSVPSTCLRPWTDLGLVWPDNLSPQIISPDCSQMQSSKVLAFSAIKGSTEALGVDIQILGVWSDKGVPPLNKRDGGNTWFKDIKDQFMNYKCYFLSFWGLIINLFMRGNAQTIVRGKRLYRKIPHISVGLPRSHCE